MEHLLCSKHSLGVAAVKSQTPQAGGACPMLLAGCKAWENSVPGKDRTSIQSCPLDPV